MLVTPRSESSTGGAPTEELQQEIGATLPARAGFNQGSMSTSARSSSPTIISSSPVAWLGLTLNFGSAKTYFMQAAMSM